jgi:glycosyltransferase involved in cell wall biosynthesis
MHSPTVTTVIPAYRAAHTITRALDSIFAQSCLPTEVLVVDDGSPDDLVGALRPYGKRVRLIRKPNGGAASARNLGIEQANGRLIAFLDADDYWEPTKLEKQVQVFHRHPEVGVSFTRWFTQSPGRERSETPWEGFPEADQVLRPHGEQVFEVATRVWTSTMVVRREILGDLRFTSGFEPAEDRELWIRLIANAPAYFLSQPLATNVFEPGSLSRSNLDVAYGNMLRVIHRYSTILGQRGVRKWELKTLRQWAAGHLGNGKPRAALAPAWKRLRLQPSSPEGWWIFLKCAAWAMCSGSDPRVPNLSVLQPGYSSVSASLR